MTDWRLEVGKVLAAALLAFFGNLWVNNLRNKQQRYSAFLSVGAVIYSKVPACKMDVELDRYKGRLKRRGALDLKEAGGDVIGINGKYYGYDETGSLQLYRLTIKNTGMSPLKFKEPMLQLGKIQREIFPIRILKEGKEIHASKIGFTLKDGEECEFYYPTEQIYSAFDNAYFKLKFLAKLFRFRTTGKVLNFSIISNSNRTNAVSWSRRWVLSKNQRVITAFRKESNERFRKELRKGKYRNGDDSQEMLNAIRFNRFRIALNQMICSVTAVEFFDHPTLSGQDKCDYAITLGSVLRSLLSDELLLWKNDEAFFKAAFAELEEACARARTYGKEELIGNPFEGITNEEYFNWIGKLMNELQGDEGMMRYKIGTPILQFITEQS